MILGSALLCQAVGTLVLAQTVWRSFKVLKLKPWGAITEIAVTETLTATTASRSSNSTASSSVVALSAAARRKTISDAVFFADYDDSPASVLRSWSLLSALAMYGSLFEWAFSWIPLYFECKLILLCWLAVQGRAASALLFQQLSPLFGIMERTFFERVIPSAYHTSIGLYARAQPHGMPVLLHCLRPDELKRWELVIQSQADLVRREMRRRGISLEESGLHSLLANELDHDDDDAANAADEGLAGSNGFDARTPSPQPSGHGSRARRRSGSGSFVTQRRKDVRFDDDASLIDLTQGGDAEEE